MPVGRWPAWGGGGGELYRDVPLNRVRFFGLAVLNRVRTCPKQGMVLQAERLTQTASTLLLFLAATRACEKLG